MVVLTRVRLMHCHRRFVVSFLARSVFFFNDPATTEIYTLSLHDALPIFDQHQRRQAMRGHRGDLGGDPRSEEHTSELQSRFDLVCRLLLEKKKKKSKPSTSGSTDRAHPPPTARTAIDASPHTPPDTQCHT